MQIKERLDALRLRAGAILRERKERAAEQKAEKQANTPSHAVPAMWVWFLGAIAVCTLLGSTWMLVVFIAGSVGHVDWTFDWRAGNDGQPARWVWSAEANVHALIGVGLFLACAGVAMYNAVWLHVREHIRSLLFRRVILAIGIAVAFFMVSGAIVTQQWGTDARTRDEVAGVQTAQAGVAAVDAEIASIETEMGRLCAPNLTTWQAQACRSGEQAWADRIGIARGQMRESDPQFQIIARAIADARQGDRWRARLTELRRQRAAAAVTTVQASVAEVRATGWFATFTHILEDLRKPFIAVLGELLAMTMFGVALEAHRSRQPYRVHPKDSGWADEGRQVEDLRDEAAPVYRSAQQAANDVLMSGGSREDAAEAARAASRMAKPDKQRRVYNAETGREEVWVQPKGHWRPTGKKQKNADGSEGEQMEFQPEPQPDEVGVPPELDNRDSELRASAFAVKEDRRDEKGDGADDIGPAHGRAPLQAPQPPRNDIEPVAPVIDEDVLAAVIQPELSLSETESLNALAEPPIDDSDASKQHDQSGGDDDEGGHLATGPENVAGDEQADEPNDLEPPIEHHETPITQEDRLLAPPESVAAE